MKLDSSVGELTGQILVRLCSKDKKEYRVEIASSLIYVFNACLCSHHDISLCCNTFPREIHSVIQYLKCLHCISVMALVMSCNLQYLCWMLAPQIYEIFQWSLACFPGPLQKLESRCDFVRSFVRQEIKKHREKGTIDEPEDFIDFYLDQIEKVSNLCCNWQKWYHSRFPARFT